MAEVTNRPWDGSKARFTLEQLMRAVPRAISAWARKKAKAEGRDVIKEDLKLPYKEPNGVINLGAVRNALAAIGGARGGVKGVPNDVIAEAKAELQRVLQRYGSAKKEYSMKLQEHAVVWQSDNPVQDCCLGTMDELVAAGHTTKCWCENSLVAVDGLMLAKDYSGDMRDFMDDDYSGTTERHLKMLYFRKALFVSPEDVDRWQVAKRLKEMRSIQTLGHEDEDIFDITKLKETDEAWISVLEGTFDSPPIDPVFSRIDVGVIGLFDIQETSD